MQIRDAVQPDMDRITAINDDVLMTSTAMYNDRPATVEERTLWWSSRVSQGFPVLVADDAGKIAGFASSGDFRTWPGYRSTVEGTVHIRPTAAPRAWDRHS